MYFFFLFQIAILFLEMLKLLVFLLSTVPMDFVNSRDMPVRRLWGKVVPVNFCMVPITQWPKEKGQKDKQRSTKHTHKTKD
jgi:hypothetical protein